MTKAISRRNVLKVSVVAGAGLMLSCKLPALSSKNDSTKPKGASLEPNVFIKVDPDGTTRVMISRSDMGQGVRTSLAMILAEEMDADWSKVIVEQAMADRKYGGQGTGGSSSVRSMYGPMRKAGAVARAMLIGAAAKQWKVKPEECTTQNGFVMNGGRKLSYGELASAASTLSVPDAGSLVMKSSDAFKIIGSRSPRIDNHDVVTGKAVYGMDVKIPGMKYASMARPPAFGGSLKSCDEAAAMKVSGVIKVLKLGNNVAVIGDNTWAALSGRQALNCEWNEIENGTSSAKILDAMKKAVAEHPAMPAGAKVVEATYELPYLAHATMEPMNCLATPGGEIWTGTQVPESAVGTAANALGVPESQIKLHVTLLGGGFGRRLQTDFIAEACQIAKAANLPVMLVWTREDDFENDHYREATYHSFRGAVAADGKPVGWSHQMISSGGSERGTRERTANMGYAIEGATLQSSGVDSPVPLGAWRSVENTFMGFVNESFIDELAIAAGKDPVQYRLENLKSERMKKCLQLAAEKAGWTNKLPAGSGRGVAIFSGYGSCIAQIVEVTVKEGKIKLDRVVAAVDCGTAINPLGVEAQVQGATVDALSTALKAGITIRNNAVVQNTWDKFDWLRMNEMPKIEVHIVPSSDGPGGMGEVGFPAVSAALANALFAATGKRVRKLPIGMTI